MFAVLLACRHSLTGQPSIKPHFNSQGISMNIYLKVLLSGGLAAGLLGAARSTVARVFRAEPVQIRGVSVDMKGLASWPVALNDDIVTKDAPANIQFSDGSSVSLQKNSQVKIQGSKNDISVRVVRGSVDYRVGPRSRLGINDAAGTVMQSST